MSHHPHRQVFHVRFSATATALLGVIALGMGTPPAHAQSSYTVTDLGVISGSVSTKATDLDDTATISGTTTPIIRIVGTTGTSTGSYYHGFYWDSVTKTLVDLGVAPGGTNSISHDVNSRGEVVGEASTTSNGGDNRAFYWNTSLGARNLVPLPHTLSNAYHSGTAVISVAKSISETGIITGILYSPEWSTTGNINTGNVPVYWKKDASGVYQCYELPPLVGDAPSRGSTGNINGSGDISGSRTAADGTGTSHSVVWKNLSGDPAAPLYGTPIDSGVNSGAIINDAGQVAGTLPPSGFFWAAPGTTSPQPMGTLGGSTIVFALSNAGQATGYSEITSGGARHAYLWPGSASVGLRDLGTLGGGGSTGNALNDAGVVVGTSDMQKGFDHAFRWTSATGLLDLNSKTLTPTKGAFSDFISAERITNRGNIAGYGMVRGNYTHAFLLTPKP